MNHEFLDYIEQHCVVTISNQSIVRHEGSVILPNRNSATQERGFAVSTSAGTVSRHRGIDLDGRT
jgi:hypothetical protein